MEFDLTIKKDWWIRYGLIIIIPKRYRYLFPQPGEKVIVVYDNEKIETHMHRGWKGYDRNRIDGLTSFYHSHHEVAVGSSMSNEDKRLRLQAYASSSD
jgi:hypothetical protein